MNPQPLPLPFLLQRGRLGWREATWGVERGWADWRLLVELAVQRLTSDPSLGGPVLDLAILANGDRYEAIELARRLAQEEPHRDDAAIRAKWMYLILRWVLEHRERFEDPLGVAEQIYADFDYPPELESMIRYMPASGGYDPRAHTLAENEARLYEAWAQFVTASERHFAQEPD